VFVELSIDVVTSEEAEQHYLSALVNFWNTELSRLCGNIFRLKWGRRSIVLAFGDTAVAN